MVDRWGDVLPDDDAGRDDLFIMLHHLARRSGDPVIRMQTWISARASWLPSEERRAIIERVLATPLRWKADTLGKRLRLTAADRTRLSIKTIGCIDQTTEQRAELRRLAKIEYKRQRRAAARLAADPA
ncbi:hypothetical protein AB8A20_08120 [Tardiphaga sp. 604_B6_N1_1]|uniref:hypothetical protein n=1 Tax=unclassified Tardiphaga TaxID=2631404 RepID=UPI003F207787